jgi:hypothetical protein
MNQKFCRRALRGRRQSIVVKFRSFCYPLLEHQCNGPIHELSISPDFGENSTKKQTSNRWPRTKISRLIEYSLMPKKNRSMPPVTKGMEPLFIVEQLD